MSLHHVIQTALRQWNRGSIETQELERLLCYRSIRDGEANLSARAAADRLLTNTLARLADRNSECAEIVSLRYQQGLGVNAVGRRLDMSESHVHRKQREAVDLFVRLIADEEECLHGRRCGRLARRLPVPAGNRLFGVEDVIERLYAELLQPEAPALVSIEGIGGIGKTAVADALMRRAIDEGVFEDFAWVSVQENAWHPDIRLRSAGQAPLSTADLLETLIVQLMGEDALPVPFTVETASQTLDRRVRSTPHLIAVDNLETMPDLGTLLPLLQELAGPTRFILTSRHRLHPQADVFPMQLSPLSQQDSIALVHYWADQTNLPEIAAASPEALNPIYETVGGNPLALRLVVGQIQYHNLFQVLESLRSARGRTVEHIYSHVYRHAWEDLNSAERSALSAMLLLPPEGGELEYLAILSGMGEDILLDALENLVACSLVEHQRHGLEQSRYSIHGLTRTFLREQGVRWNNADAT